MTEETFSVENSILHANKKNGRLKGKHIPNLQEQYRFIFKNHINRFETFYFIICNKSGSKKHLVFYTYLSPLFVLDMIA